jgi:hypothetical protein
MEQNEDTDEILPAAAVTRHSRLRWLARRLSGIALFRVTLFVPLKIRSHVARAISGWVHSIDSDEEKAGSARTISHSFARLNAQCRQAVNRIMEA